MNSPGKLRAQPRAEDEIDRGDRQRHVGRACVVAVCTGNRRQFDAGVGSRSANLKAAASGSVAHAGCPAPHTGEERSACHPAGAPRAAMSAPRRIRPSWPCLAREAGGTRRRTRRHPRHPRDRPARRRPGRAGRRYCRDAVDDPQVKRLLTVAGINAIVATGIIAAIGDITRFREPRKLVSYFGAQSPGPPSGLGVAQHGRISKHGLSHARGLLVEATWAASKASRPLRAFCASAPSAGTRWRRCQRPASSLC
jgi:transposase